jgi:EAL domain-containing protein (putative c-di-GMP-specific phosphodiesterase class I)
VKLEADLRSAISRDEFELYYHPQVDVETARLIGLEALIRWNHPRLGLVSPVRFISLAEETGLIVPLTEWVLRRACEQNKEWQNLGFPVVRIAVNLSPRQFQQRVVVPAVVKALQLTGLQPHCLEVEITESAAMQDADYTITAIRALQEMGVEVAMDDFGTGFSSLSHLKRLPFDTIKIDQTFVRDIATDPGSAAIVATIIDLTHNLGRKVIAEGVENEQQLLFLRMHGCHRIQGYLISKPMPAQELTRLLATRGPGAVNRVAPEAGAETLAEIIAHYSYPLPSPERLTGGITAVR